MANMETTTAVAVREQAAGSVAVWQPAAERAQEYMRHAKADATVRAYESDWRGFTAWCSDNGLPSMPADPRTVALYLADQASKGMKPATLARKLATISKAHQAAGHDSPASMKHAAVSETWKGIRRTHGVAQNAKAPAITDDIRRMVGATEGAGNALLAIRDRALLLIGFAAALRRSELVALDTTDIAETADGLVVTLRRSKTDQDGAGRKVAVPYGSDPLTCPVRALRAWYTAAGIADGAVFRSVDRHGNLKASRLTDQSVALVVKRYAEAAGLDSAKYSGHSLRAGLATAAAAAGVAEHDIMRTTGHKSVVMLRRYVREANLFRNCAAAKVGL